MNKEQLKTLENQGYVKKRCLPKWHPMCNNSLYHGDCVVEVALHNGDRMAYDINQIEEKASELKEDIADITSTMGEKYATAANDNLRCLEGKLWRKRRELPYLQEVDKFFRKIVEDTNIIKCYIGDGGGVFAPEDNSDPYWPHEFKNSSVYLTKPPKEDRKCGGYVVFAMTDHSFYNGKMWLSFRIDFMPKNESPRGKYAIMHVVYRGDKETGTREMSSTEMKPFYGYGDRDYINPYEVAQFNYLCDKVEELTKALFDRFDQIALNQQEESNEAKSNNE